MHKEHTPVLLHEVVSILKPEDGKIYVDATFGRGGYSKALLESANAKVIAIDQDIHVKPFAKEFEELYRDRFTFLKGNFKEIKYLLSPLVKNINGGILFDIGVSSMQLDTPSRGFSFSKDGPLDMRMDNASTISAFDIVNTYKEEALANCIYKYGEETYSRRIAHAIVEAREIKPITTTLELATIVRRAIGPNKFIQKSKIDPATKTFQAIRIEVNGELDALNNALLEAADMLDIGALLIVVTFHSLEDSIVKSIFSNLCGKRLKINKYKPTDAILHKFEHITKKPITPSSNEVTLNPRARSAKLRVIKKIAL